MVVQLLHERVPPPPPRRYHRSGGLDDERSFAGLLDCIARATEGKRNGVLYWAARRCQERGTLTRQAEAELIGAARSAGLPEIEARRTVASAGRST